MKIFNILKHILVVLAGVTLLLGVPFVTTDYFKSMLAGDVDALTSATVVIEQPSGDYIVLINKDLHINKENLNTWIRFFSGEEISYLFEDISCSVISGDTGALTMAQSFQSRLPERQMTLLQEDPTLLMSRADNGKYDVIIISKEFAENYNVETVNGESTKRIDIAGGSN
jgi:hypothetical protein